MGQSPTEGIATQPNPKQKPQQWGYFYGNVYFVFLSRGDAAGRVGYSAGAAADEISCISFTAICAIASGTALRYRLLGKNLELLAVCLYKVFV